SDPDLTPPTMTTPPNITVSAAIGPFGTVRVYYDPPVANDGSISLPVVCTPASGSTFGVGPTTVSCSARDVAGNARTRSFTVTVNRVATATSPTATSGATVIVVASGFLPGSLVGVRLFSSPISLGVFEVGTDGSVQIPVTLPADLPPGEHEV